MLYFKVWEDLNKKKVFTSFREDTKKQQRIFEFQTT